MIIKPGDEFTHSSILDPDWRPDIQAGERYKDAPKARMRVTRVANHRVWFGYARDKDTNAPGGFMSGRSFFERAYGAQCTASRSPE